MAAAALTPRSFDTAFMPFCFPGVTFMDAPRDLTSAHGIAAFYHGPRTAGVSAGSLRSIIKIIGIAQSGTAWPLHCDGRFAGRFRRLLHFGRKVPAETPAIRGQSETTQCCAGDSPASF